jgi:hypothetical protein
MGRNPSAVPSSSKFLAFHLGSETRSDCSVLSTIFHLTQDATTWGINISGPGRVESDLSVKTKTHFTFRVDIWDDTGDSIVEHVAGVDDFEVAEATYRASRGALASGAHHPCGRAHESCTRAEPRWL